MGKMLTSLPRLLLAQLRLTLRTLTGCMRRRDLNFPHRPDGKIADVLALPHACTKLRMLGSTECACRRGRENSHGKIADTLALILACATATDELVNYSRYVPHSLTSSHRPHGKIAYVLAPTHTCTTANGLDNSSG